MNKTFRLSKSAVGLEELNALSEVIQDGYLGMGSYVQAFEKELQEFLTPKNSSICPMRVACVNTGTSALHLALQACGVGIGDEVIVPSVTYVACFQAITATGAKAIPCDIDSVTGCMDVENARSRITSRTKAILYVHYASNLGQRDQILQLCQDHRLRLIEDAAHSFGGFNKGERIGASGDITCFSFDGIKNITCGEGGAVVSQDEKLIESIQDLRLLAVNKDSANRYQGKRSWDFDVTEQGWRYHMSNLNAAIGRTQLKKIDLFGDKRRTLARTYCRSIKNVHVRFLQMDLENSIPHIFPIFVRQDLRDDLREYLAVNGVETGLHYKPNHLLTKFNGENCKNAERFGNEVLTLPLHYDLDVSDVKEICVYIERFLAAS